MYVVPECVSVVFADIFRVERLVIKEIWSEVVDDGVEGQAVPEGSGQVGDVNVGVVGSHLAAPDLERSQSFDLNRRHHFVVNHLEEKTKCQETHFIGSSQSNTGSNTYYYIYVYGLLTNAQR